MTLTEKALILNILVQPRASKNQLCGMQGNELKIRLTSPPVDGAANKLCREFIADLCGVPKSSVEIIAGETSRHKRIRIESIDPAQLATTCTLLCASPSIRAKTTSKGL